MVYLEHKKHVCFFRAKLCMDKMKHFIKYALCLEQENTTLLQTKKRKSAENGLFFSRCENVLLGDR